MQTIVLGLLATMTTTAAAAQWEKRTYQWTGTFHDEENAVPGVPDAKVGIIWTIEGTFEPLSFGVMTLSNILYFTGATSLCDQDYVDQNSRVVTVAKNFEISFASDMTLSTTKPGDYTPAALATTIPPGKSNGKFILGGSEYNQVQDYFLFDPIANHYVMPNGWELTPDTGTREIRHQGGKFWRVKNYECADVKGYGDSKVPKDGLPAQPDGRCADNRLPAETDDANNVCYSDSGSA